MKIISGPFKLQDWRRSFKPSISLGFVPTMGALHQGHEALIKKSLAENDITVVSIFVNPIQFGPNEDFKRYPRPWKKDKDLLRGLGVDLLFAPSPASMYSREFSTAVSLSSLTNTLCGSLESRGPHHFVGVATVVAKLFNLVRPARAYFGLKDFQQVRVIEQMTEDLNFDIKIVRCPTVREKDGLAVSSRNAYLSPSERAVAPRIYLALQQGRKLLTSNRKMSPALIRRHVREQIEKIPHSKIDYIELVDPTTLQKIQTPRFPILLAVAVNLGATRLIDNIIIRK